MDPIYTIANALHNVALAQISDTLTLKTILTEHLQEQPFKQMAEQAKAAEAIIIYQIGPHIVARGAVTGVLHSNQDRPTVIVTAADISLQQLKHPYRRARKKIDAPHIVIKGYHAIEGYSGYVFISPARFAGFDLSHNGNKFCRGVVIDARELFLTKK